MKDYYELFIQLSMQQCTKNDYANKQKVKEHNLASKKKKQLQEEMKNIGCVEILENLLCHEDDRVKINAAALCLEMRVFIEKASLVLKNIMESSSDTTLRFSARMILQTM